MSWDGEKKLQRITFPASHFLPFTETFYSYASEKRCILKIQKIHFNFHIDFIIIWGNQCKLTWNEIHLLYFNQSYTYN